MLRKIYGTAVNNGEYRCRINHELCQLYTDIDMVNQIKINGLCWLDHEEILNSFSQETETRFAGNIKWPIPCKNFVLLTRGIKQKIKLVEGISYLHFARSLILQLVIKTEIYIFILNYFVTFTHPLYPQQTAASIDPLIGFFLPFLDHNSDSSGTWLNH